jgi:hypothetical protein
MASELAMEATEQYVITMLRYGHERKQEAIKWVDHLVQTVRQHSGKVQARAQKPSGWEVFDGKEHFVSPNHLSPACFDFNMFLVFAFERLEEVQHWWHSDAVFACLKSRGDLIEKWGLFVVDGLATSFDILDRERFQFGEKFILLEPLQMTSFRPVQSFVDDYKRLAKRSMTDAGVDVHTIMAEGVKSMLMNEFPLDAVIATTWRLRDDAVWWYESDLYRKELMLTRQEFSNSMAILIPIYDEPPTQVVSRSGMVALNFVKTRKQSVVKT